MIYNENLAVNSKEYIAHKGLSCSQILHVYIISIATLTSVG